MATKHDVTPNTPESLDALQARLNELEETVRAIRCGEVDAVVVSSSGGERVFTLEGADHPYRVMVEAINEGAATLTPAGLILYANRRFAEMVEVPLEALIGSKLHDHVRITNGCDLDESLRDALTVPQKEECLLLVTGGKVLPAYLSLSPLEGSDFQGVCMVATDLTEQKSRQEELARANEQLRSEIGQRNRVESALRQLTGRLLNVQDEERRRIARDLHDSTAQNLNRLVLNLAYIQNEGQAQGKLSVPELITESIGVAQQASKEIRDLSHLLYPPALDEMGLAEAIRGHAARTSEVTGIEISLDVPPDMARLPREVEVALFRVLQESLENVRRHSGSPTAQVRLAPQQQTVLLEIRDQGHGMPSGLLAESGENAATTGLGLAGMRERLRQLGGRCEIESSDRGTTVRATVPVALRQEPEARPGTSSPLRVLIVDDSPVVRRSVRELLGSNPHLETVGEAADGREAIQRTVEVQPDIVLLDITMPVMGGIEASRKIRALAPRAQIVAFSLDDSPTTIQEARNAGALAYVLKSDAARDLMPAIRAASEGKSFFSSTLARLFPAQSS
jgi:PAS domain S-box-containing protein